jgi:sugar/nucleoside kinase (ribokinase family)
MLSQLMYAPKGAKITAEHLREVMTYANAAGAFTCTRRGVIPSLPTAAELDGFLASRGG